MYNVCENTNAFRIRSYTLITGLVKNPFPFHCINVTYYTTKLQLCKHDIIITYNCVFIFDTFRDRVISELYYAWYKTIGLVALKKS